MVDEENFSLVRNFRAEGKLREPLRRASQSIVTRHTLLAYDGEKCVSREGIERLHPSVGDHWECGEFFEMESFLRNERPEHGTCHEEQAERGDQPR